MRKKFNENLMEALKCFDDFTKEHGYPPTCREFCSLMNYTSSSTGYRYIEGLIKAGYLKKTGDGSRNIQRVRQIDEPDDTVNYDNFFADSFKVPIIGTVTAGNPITAFEENEGYISFITNRHFSAPLFALKVRGESMINAGIYDGDLIIAERTSVANNGDIVVVLTDDNENATVKTFYKENGHFRLQPENDYMKPIIKNEVNIIGKVVGLQRNIIQ